MGILKYQEQNSWLKSNIILTVTRVLFVYSHLIFSGKRRRTSSLMRWWKISVSPFNTSRPPHTCCSLVISTLLSLQLSWRINKLSNWGSPSWICVTEPERIHIVVCGSVSVRVCVCVCAFVWLPLGDVFISFDLMTVNGKCIKQNAPPLFFFISSVPIKQMDTVAG